MESFEAFVYLYQTFNFFSSALPSLFSPCPIHRARWVTEMQDLHKMKDTAGDLSDGRGAGIDNLLYSADAEFSCFADLALVSPGEYYKPGEGSLMQVTT